MFLTLAAIGCAPARSPPAGRASAPVAILARDAGVQGFAPEPDAAGPPSAASIRVVTAVDACGPLDPAFDADENGVRAILSRQPSDSDCAPVDLDGKAPCEVACTLRTTGDEPLFRTREHTIYFTTTGRTPKQLGRFVTYDGALDATNARTAAQATTYIFLDPTTAPPTLELRAGSCLFECEGFPRKVDPDREAASRATCRPKARYRRVKDRLQLVR
jgi:hypothetical protein